MMELVLFGVLLLTCALAMLEDRLRKYNLAIYIALGVILVLFAGLREIGFDRDSENYEWYFYHYDTPGMELVVEPSFRLLSAIGNAVFGDVRPLFLLYALVGVSLKMYALRRLSEFWFLPICVYLSCYYLMHDFTQIRAGIVSALTLLAIPYICDGKRRTALIILLTACLFHYSAITLLPILFLSRKDMSVNNRILWGALFPLGYVIYTLQIGFFNLINIPYITDKLIAYEQLRDKGLMADSGSVLNLVVLLESAVYLYVLFFYNEIKSRCKYITIVTKIMGIYIFLYPALFTLPVISTRIGELYGIARILIFPYVCYTIKPLWVGKLLVVIYSIIYFCFIVYNQGIFEPL